MNDGTEKQILAAAPVVYHGPAMWWLAVAVLIAGAAMPLLNVADSNWFSRSGCFVVMLGIWSGLGGLIRGKILDKTLAMRFKRSRRLLRSRYRNDPEVMKQELEKLDRRFADLNDKHHSKLHLSVGVQEAVLLLVGTFVWGFGDLIRFVI